MHRRRLLATAATGAAGVTVGCLGRLPTVGSDVRTSFELADTEYDVDDDPAVTVVEDTVVAAGTVKYGSSWCGTVELAHAAYEDSQDRLDLLVVAADDSGRDCTDDLARSGYRVEASVDGRLRRVSVTEHHVFGETYSTTATVDDRDG